MNNNLVFIVPFFLALDIQFPLFNKTDESNVRIIFLYTKDTGRSSSQLSKA